MYKTASSFTLRCSHFSCEESTESHRHLVHVLLFSKPSLYCCNNALSTAATASFHSLILTLKQALEILQKPLETFKKPCIEHLVHVLLFSRLSLYCCNKALSTAAAASFQSLILTLKQA